MKPDKTEFNSNVHPYLDIVTIINAMLPSYIALAYHYNSYID
jgi:hypothetical protein